MIGTRAGWSRWQVEQKGIDWVSDAERHGQTSNLCWPLLAANLSFFPVAVGVFIVDLGLSWWQAAVAVIVGLAISYPLVGLVALAGQRGGAPTMTLSRASLGYHGNKLPTAMNYCSAIGWEGVSLALASLTTRTMLKRISPGWDNSVILSVSYVVTAAATIVIAVYGHQLIMRAQRWIALAVSAAIVTYFVIVIPKLHFTFTSAQGTSSLVAGIVFVMAGNGLTRVTVAADYSRRLPQSASGLAVVGWMSFGAAIAPAVLLLFGVLLTTSNPQLALAVTADPIGALADQLPTWFLVPFLLTTILSIIAAGVVNMYSSGMMLLALGVRLRRPVAVLTDAALMMAVGLYLVFAAPTFFGPFNAFLTVIAVGKAAWVAIFLMDLWLYSRHGYCTPDLYTPTGVYGRFNMAGLLSLLVAAAVGFGLVTSKDPNVGKVVGYLLTPSPRAGIIGVCNLGVLAAFVIAGVMYLTLSKPRCQQPRRPRLSARTGTNSGTS